MTKEPAGISNVASEAGLQLEILNPNRNGVTKGDVVDAAGGGYGTLGVIRNQGDATGPFLVHLYAGDSTTHTVMCRLAYTSGD